MSITKTVRIDEKTYNKITKAKGESTYSTYLAACVDAKEALKGLDIARLQALADTAGLDLSTLITTACDALKITPAGEVKLGKAATRISEILTAYIEETKEAPKGHAFGISQAKVLEMTGANREAILKALRAHKKLIDEHHARHGIVDIAAHNQRYKAHLRASESVTDGL